MFLTKINLFFSIFMTTFMEVLWHCWLAVGSLGSIPKALVGFTVLFLAIALRVVTIHFENKLKKEVNMETNKPIKSNFMLRFKASLTHVLSAVGAGCANGILLTSNDKDSVRIGTY